MNQKQRDFLLESILRKYREEERELVDRRPKAPSLNNYLVAAILDGSFVMRSQEEVREGIRQRVRDLGKGDSLLETNHHFGRSRGEETDVVSLPALLLFGEPPAYTEARVVYEKRLAEWKEEKRRLDAAHEAMRIKIQIGSDVALATIVAQADKLCSISLSASSQMFLPGPAQP